MSNENEKTAAVGATEDNCLATGKPIDPEEFQRLMKAAPVVDLNKVDVKDLAEPLKP